ncbi:MAG: EAL domain-containing protein [Rubrivivax sp.]
MLLRLATGRPLVEVAALVAAVCVAIACGAYVAGRSHALRRLEGVLFEQAQQSLRFDATINNMTQGLCFFDHEHRLIVCNNRYADLYRLPRDLMRPGTTLAEIVDHRYQSGCFPKMERSAYLEWRGRLSVSDKPSQTFTELNDGRTLAIKHQPMPGGGWVATHEDITERKRWESEIERMARHDALTGLPNRLFFGERLERSLASIGAGESLTVLCIDLDRFKAVNDTLGHPVGDALLQAVAGRLGDCVRQNDFVARLGGDEFAIIQCGAPQPAASIALATRLVDAVAAPFDVAGHKVCVGASVGAALSPQDGNHASDLLKRADLALYAAKSAGGGQSRPFQAQMDECAQQRRALEVDFRQAAANGELELFYQPIFDLMRRQVVAFEALLRWRHPTRGLVMPEAFIPLAEETGLIQPIGEWVLHAAFAEAVRWPSTVGVAVNLSPVQLRAGDFVETVARALAATGLAPERVDLEITESVLLVENSINLTILRQLLALGVHVSLDDFGVGYSSLSYLRSFPFHKLKIDRSFVRDVVDNHQAAAIVRAIASLGSCLEMVIIAEGVEQPEQLDALQALGCHAAQGYHLGRPAPASEIAALLSHQTADPAEPPKRRLALVGKP